MRRAYLFGGLAFGAAAVVWSCGLDDSAVFSLDQDASTSDGSSFDGTAGDSGGSDANTQSDTGTSDSGFDAGPCAAGDLPTCDNGSCTSGSQVCTPPIPAGWHVTNLIAGRRKCDPAYGGDAGGHDVVLLGDGGAAACACDCEATGNPSCANAHVKIDLGAGATCNVASDSFDMVSNCADLGGLTIGANSQATVSIATGATCGGTTDASVPDVDGGLAQTCDFSADAAAPICQGHRACVPAPTNGHVCIAHAASDGGALMCPTGFSYAFSSTIADSYADTRACSQCVCGFTGIGCTNPVVSFYASLGCGGSGTPVTQATCSDNGSGLSVGLAGTDAPSCFQTDGGAPQGSVTSTNDEVVCCSN